MGLWSRTIGGWQEMINCILVPLDGSPHAEMSLPHAVALAHASGSSITLLRSVPAVSMITPVNGGFPIPTSYSRSELSDLQQEIQDEQTPGQDYLETIADHLRVEERLEVSTVVLDGDPCAAIVHYAEQHPEVNL